MQSTTSLDTQRQNPSGPYGRGPAPEIPDIKELVVRVASVIFGLFSSAYILKNHKLIVALPLLSVTATASAVGNYYPGYVLGLIGK